MREFDEETRDIGGQGERKRRKAIGQFPPLGEAAPSGPNHSLLHREVPTMRESSRLLFGRRHQRDYVRVPQHRH